MAESKEQASAKVAIVTGAAGMRATGRGIAVYLAREGYHVTVVDIHRAESQLPPDEVRAGWKGIESVKAEIEALGRRAICVYADIQKSADVEAMTAATLAAFGRIDLLVNNARASPTPTKKTDNSSSPLTKAALNRLMDDVVDLDEAEWDRNMNINAKGTFLCSRAVARYFLANGVRGRIINVSSSGAKVGGRGLAAYASSKQAIHALTQCMALELAEHGVTVNTVCPGLIDSGRFSPREVAVAESLGLTLEEYQRRRMQEQSKQIPTGRTTTPEDIAALVAFLASPLASQITGQCININGGTVMH